MMVLLSIKEATSKGIERLRKPIWATPEDHLKIDIFDGAHGPWFHLYAPFNKECNGRDPVDFLCLGADTDAQEWEPYEGPLPDSAEYKAACAKYDGVMKNEPTGSNSG